MFIYKENAYNIILSGNTLIVCTEHRKQAKSRETKNRYASAKMRRKDNGAESGKKRQWKIISDLSTPY